MLGDDIAQALPELQAHAESMMRTRCRIRRITGIEPDPETGRDVVTYEPEPVYQGWQPGCKIQDRDLQVSLQEIPGATAAVSRLEAHVPVSAGPFQDGDIVETFADDDTEYTTPRRTFRVAGRHTKTWQTAQRLPVEELS